MSGGKRERRERRERKQRKYDAGSRTVVCGHSLHGLLTRKGQANNAGQQSSQSEQ